MRRIYTLSIIVELLLIGILVCCNKVNSSNDGGSSSNGSGDLTACEQAAQKWGQIWTVKTEDTGLTSDTPDNDLMDVWGSGSDDIYVVVFAGNILHFDGAVWTQMNPGTSERLHGIWGYVLKDQAGSVLRKDVFAVGENGTILRFNGTTWQTQLVYFTDPTQGNAKIVVTDDISDVWGIPPTAVSGEPIVIAVGADGLIVAYDQPSKTFEEMRQQVTVQHGNDANGNPQPDTIEYHRWTQDQLNGVFGVSASDFVAVGYAGNILAIDSTNLICARVTVPNAPGLTTYLLNGVWGQGGELYVVGNEGRVIRRHSGTWSELSLDLPPTYLRSSWSFYQERCGEIPDGGTEADRPTTSWRIYVGWDGTLYFDHDNLLCPLGEITSNRLEAVWGTTPRSLSLRTTTTTDANGAPVTTWVCDPVDILIAGVDGTLIRLTNKGAE